MTLREVLKDESCWCKGMSAQSRYGKSVPIASEMACRFCLHGAMEKSQFWPTVRLKEAIEKLFPERWSKYCHDLAKFNDHPDTTFADITAVLDEAGL